MSIMSCLIPTRIARITTCVILLGHSPFACSFVGEATKMDQPAAKKMDRTKSIAEYVFDQVMLFSLDLKWVITISTLKMSVVRNRCTAGHQLAAWPISSSSIKKIIGLLD